MKFPEYASCSDLVRLISKCNTSTNDYYILLNESGHVHVMKAPKGEARRAMLESLFLSDGSVFALETPLVEAKQAESAGFYEYIKNIHDQLVEAWGKFPKCDK